LKIDRDSLHWRSLPGRESADPFEGLEQKGFSARLVRIEAGAKRSPHVHAGIPEMIYVIEGSGHFWEDGTARRIRAGDFVLVSADVPHATVPDDQVDVELLCFWPHPDGASTTRELQGLIHLDDETPAD
jgi:quercetin dioxygenase-like cupin family protein